MGSGIELAGGSVHCCLGSEHQFQQLLQPGVHIGLGDLAGLHSLYQLPDGVVARAGHFQGGAVLDPQGMVVGAAPVGDHSPLKAPVLPQDILQQVGVLVGVGAVDQVVGRHDGLGLSLFDHHLKARQVDLPEGALVQDGIRGHAPQLLAVGRKVLGAGGNAAFLDAPDVGSGHFAGQIGVLREILKVPAAQGAALDVQAGAQQHRYPLGSSFFAHGPAHSLPQGRVPAVGHGGRGGEAGGRHTGVQAQMVGSTGLLADAVGAVGQGNGRDALARQSPGSKHRLAREQRTFLFQVQTADDICIVHGIFLFAFSGSKRPAVFTQRAFWYRFNSGAASFQSAVPGRIRR